MATVDESDCHQKRELWRQDRESVDGKHRDVNPTGLSTVAAIFLLSAQANLAKGQGDEPVALDVNSTQQLSIPAAGQGKPAAGQRVRVTPPEYAGTAVFHTIYLPKSWRQGGEKLPIIFEYTGNYFPKAGSTGRVEDAGLGYGLSAGKYIWVSLPYISRDHTANEVTWWGDQAATVQYAKLNVPRIMDQFAADSGAVFLCGFSRGAIAVNYIGLHDDEIASLWTAFITHDHFDGVKEWGKSDWGSPLEKYRAEAAQRLKRVAGRPYLVSQNGKGYGSEKFIHCVLATPENFTFSYIDTGAIFGGFPHELAKAGHTDRWLLVPSKYRAATWQWMNRVTAN
jgi:hypothetical protein